MKLIPLITGLAFAALPAAAQDSLTVPATFTSIYTTGEDGPESGAIDYAELHPEGTIRVSIFPCGGVRISSHSHIIYDHPAKCPKKREDD